MKFDRTANSPFLSPGSASTLLTKCRVRDGGVSAHAKFVSRSFRRASQRDEVFFEKGNVLEAVAGGAELRGPHGHHVVRVFGEQGKPVAESAGVEHLRFTVQKLDDLSVEDVPGAQSTVARSAGMDAAAVTAPPPCCCR